MALCRSFACHFRRIFTILAAVALAPAALAQPGHGQHPTSAGNDQELQTLVEQLDSREFRDREMAEFRLSQMGIEAVPRIAQRLIEGSPEASFRAGRVLVQIGMRASEAEMTRVAGILHYLGDHGFPHLGAPARQMFELWKQGEIERTVAKIAQTGIELVPLAGGMDAGRLVVISRTGEWPVPPSEPVVEPVEAPRDDEPRPSTDELLHEVAMILDESGDKFEARRDATLAAQSSRQAAAPVDVPAFEEVTILADGRIVNLANSRGSFMATVRADAADVHEGLRMLPKLPAVSHIEFVERTVGVEDLELLTTVPNLSMVVLTRCSYDPRKVLKFIASHPAIQISASGHDAFLGVSLQPAEMDDPFEASSLPEESAAPGQRTYCRVATVVEDSAASRAGIREGDVILELDNYPISSFSELVVVIASHQPGDSIPIRFVQDGEPRDASITLGSRPPGQ